MIHIFKPAIAAGLMTALAAPMMAAPAAAQVNGISTSSPEAAIARSAARIAGYQQIEQTFAAQIGQARTIQQEITTLQTSLDSNSDGQLTEQEVQANPNVVQQIQQKEQQLGQVSQPIVLAQYYVIEQLLNDYVNAQTQAMQQKGVQLLLSPEAIQKAPDNFAITSDIVAILDQRLPTVSTTPPADYRPRRDTAAMHQAVQQILGAVAQQQAIRAAQQQQQQAPATQQPTGR